MSQEWRLERILYFYTIIRILIVTYLRKVHAIVAGEKRGNCILTEAGILMAYERERIKKEMGREGGCGSGGRNAK